MIDRNHDLPLVRQAELLRLSRSTLYYEPQPVPAAELAIMRRIDELHLDYPFAGSRMLRDLLRGEGIAIGRELVATMMRRMSIEALYRRPNTSKPADGHKIFPYLLRGLGVERPNQVWAMDITYIPMARGFVYLAAVMDWFSRRVLAWRLSRSPWRSSSALRRSRRRWPGTADRRSSIPTKAASSGSTSRRIHPARQFQPPTYRSVVTTAAENLCHLTSRSPRGGEQDDRTTDATHIELAVLRSRGRSDAAFYNRKRPHSRLAARTPDRAYFDHLPLLAAA